jgi:hypothetical protein
VPIVCIFIPQKHTVDLTITYISLSAPCPDGNGCCPTGTICSTDGVHCDVPCGPLDTPCGRVPAPASPHEIDRHAIGLDGCCLAGSNSVCQVDICIVGGGGSMYFFCFTL